MSDTTTLNRWRAAAEQATRAGATVLADWENRFTVSEKRHADLVTEADLAAQNAIRTYLHRTFPDHAFLGEEDVKIGEPDPRPAVDAPPTWVVDPLDGTTNYVHGFPLYAVSVGLCVANEPVAGAIFVPRLNEMFSAASGQGATVNGRAIRVSRAAELREALMATGFAPGIQGQELALQWWRSFLRRSQGLRRTGSTAINLAYTAAGRFDCFWAFDNHAWDVMAGVVIVREAGGTVTRPDGSCYDPFRPECVATNGLLHAELIQFFREGSAGS